MSGTFRARRPASPPPPSFQAHPPPSQPPPPNSGPSSSYIPTGVPTMSTQRFPHPREDHLDADEKRAAASKGYAPARINASLGLGLGLGAGGAGTGGGAGGKGRRGAGAPGGMNLTSGEWKLLVLIVLVACGVRLFRLSKPNSVVFDEVHFGKFASRYIKTRYFMDVHPPLAKLLITLAAFIFGYDGNFDFETIGKIYERVPYVAMRMVPATLGVATIPLAYLTLRMLDCRATTALLASVFLTFENGLVTQSRYILLDSPLVFFTALTVFFWTGFANEDARRPRPAEDAGPFSAAWWTWLALSGLSLGAVVSCKWVGLFTIATVGLSTLVQLWTLLGDLRVSPRLWMRHFMARAVCLIVLPVVFYMCMFQIHFLILENSGEGDGFMSSEFQHTLGGRGMEDTFADVAVGSTITIRHVNTQGGYLHSHPHNYPGGSKQQQITLYPHRDDNNNWRIVNASLDGSPSFDWEHTLPLTYIHAHMRVKLQHVPTEKRLHSHDIRPPVSDVEFQNEVSAYGMPGFVGDANDDWIVEIERGDVSRGWGDRGGRDLESWKRLRTLRTHFRLRHALTGCYLFSHKVKLPEWGYEQQEVTCNKNAVKANSLWYVETSWHPLLPPDAEKVNYKLPGFLAKFLELQRVMWTTNAGLTDRHTYDSRPEAWPRLRRGINFWVKDHRQIYLIGNPMVWYLSTVSVVLYLTVRGVLVLRAKRGFRDFDNIKIVKYDQLCGFLFTGWLLHYAPFFLMGRQLFLHHYFPALYFAVLLACGIFDLLTSALRPRTRLQIAAVLGCLAVWNFVRLSPLAYGTPWTKAECERARWLKTWDFSCNDFYESYSQYNVNAATLSTNSSPALSTIGGAADGRPPVVAVNPGNAENKNGHAVVVNLETVVAEHIAEPGRDVFAGEQGAKSDTMAVPSSLPLGGEEEVGRGQGEGGEGEEKVISSVVVPPAGAANRAGGKGRGQGKAQVQGAGPGKADELRTAPAAAASDSPSASAISSTAASNSESGLESTTTAGAGAGNEEDEEAIFPDPDPSSPQAAGAAAAGPLGEAEVEAEKAAAELFPDAAR